MDQSAVLGYLLYRQAMRDARAYERRSRRSRGQQGPGLGGFLVLSLVYGFVRCYGFGRAVYLVLRRLFLAFCRAKAAKYERMLLRCRVLSLVIVCRSIIHSCLRRAKEARAVREW